MSKNRFDYLLQQYLSGDILEEEEKELLLFIQLMDDENIEKKFSSYWDGYDARHTLPEIKSEQILKPIQRDIRKSRIRKLYLWGSSIAAAFILLLLGGFWASQAFFSSDHFIRIHAEATPSEQATAYDRVLILDDGSRVVLKSGSKLLVPSDFNRAKRIVKLVGEAYFDIAHNKNKPFVIKTGDVKTTVLGTAFNIKAWPRDNQVDVSVKRGKVRVDDGSEKPLATLSVNQAIEYHMDEARIARKDGFEQVEAATKWVGSGVCFDHVSFLDIARTLSKRYGVDIQIENQQIAGMVLVSSFEGTESLPDVLDILCGVSGNMSYTLKNNAVIISHSASQEL